jgi:hypothetical protein
MCQCDCGEFKEVCGGNLKSGSVSSCGCRHHEKLTKHGMSKDKSVAHIYKRWVDMRQRCNNPKINRYNYYGGRGITICERWNEFTHFFEDMSGSFTPGMTLERIDSNGNYEPSNCIWADSTHQQNNKRNNRKYMYEGKLLTIPQWSRNVGIMAGTLKSRLRYGWTIERALTTPNKSYFWERNHV